MNIGLTAVDSVYPNLALMKISSWHKAKGDCVEWYNPFDEYDVVYMSKVFESLEKERIRTVSSALPTVPRDRGKKSDYTAMAKGYGFMGRQETGIPDV